MPRSGNTTSPIDSTDGTAGPPPDTEPPIVGALTLAHSRKQPERVGQTTIFRESGRSFIGRGDEIDHAVFSWMHPGVIERGEAFTGEKFSRRHVQVDVTGDEVVIENLGRFICMRVNGVEQKRATLAPGDVIEIDNHSIFFFSTRRAEIPKFDYPLFPFGGADPFKMVGESDAIWALRERVAFVALFDKHVLILGQTGTGKELVAHALHVLSDRAGGPFVDCNAAAFPDTLADVELFGCERNHPPGMPERIGFVGLAQNGTLFLDEIGRLSPIAQPKLLRVLDPGGRYNRLGNPKSLVANVRFIGAMNKPPSSLEFDLAPRLPLRVAIPPLDERREDIPLLVRHLVLEAAAANPKAGVDRFIRRVGDRDEINIEPALVMRLLRHQYPANMRDLVRILAEAMATKGDTLRLTATVEAALAAEPSPREAEEADDATEATGGPLDKANVLAALEHHRWHQQRTAASLGLTRHQLARLMTRHGLRAT